MKKQILLVKVNLTISPCCSRCHAEYDAKIPLVIVGATDAEFANLSSTFYMCTKTRTYIVVSYKNKP